MNNALNVREIAGTNPDYLGFIFYKQSPRYIGNEPDPELFSGVPDHEKKAGVFVNENNQSIIDHSLRWGLDLVQLHGSESPSDCGELKSEGLTVMKAFSIGAGFSFTSLINYLPVCDYFLFDTKSEAHGGSGRKFDWSLLNEYSFDKPFFLSGGIGPGDAELIRSLVNKGLYAVDINSRFERAPGIKDTIMVRNFIEKIKQ